MGSPLLAVLEDDPTGTQSVHETRVLLMPESMSDVNQLDDGTDVVYVVTNTRAYDPRRARTTIVEICRWLTTIDPDVRIVLRGDSTLRGHLREEYEAVCEALYGGRTVPLLLVPALPSAHRVTIGGEHFLSDEHGRTPLAETEYARDGIFSYTTSVLTDWASERSSGLFERADARTIPLSELRSRGEPAVVRALEELVDRGAPAILAPDAATEDDIELIGRAVQTMWQRRLPFVVRSAPALAASVSGRRATGYVSLPRNGGRVLLVVGSYVANTTRQLSTLLAEFPDALIEADVEALAADGHSEIRRLAAAVDETMQLSSLAILATPRARPTGVTSLEAGERVAHNFARVLTQLSAQPSLVIAKGGITSAVTARIGLGARTGMVVGRVADGVALWELDSEWGPTPYVVVPGNVGDEGLLLSLVRRATEASAPA